MHETQATQNHAENDEHPSRMPSPIAWDDTGTIHSKRPIQKIWLHGPQEFAPYTPVPIVDYCWMNLIRIRWWKCSPKDDGGEFARQHCDAKCRKGAKMAGKTKQWGKSRDKKMKNETSTSHIAQMLQYLEYAIAPKGLCFLHFLLPNLVVIKPFNPRRPGLQQQMILEPMHSAVELCLHFAFISFMSCDGSVTRPCH